jgi:hypothetical protein
VGGMEMERVVRQQGQPTSRPASGRCARITPFSECAGVCMSLAGTSADVRAYLMMLIDADARQRSRPPRSINITIATARAIKHCLQSSLLTRKHSQRSPVIFRTSSHKCNDSWPTIQRLSYC